MVRLLICDGDESYPMLMSCSSVCVCDLLVFAMFGRVMPSDGMRRECDRRYESDMARARLELTGYLMLM